MRNVYTGGEDSVGMLCSPFFLWTEKKDSSPFTDYSALYSPLKIENYLKEPNIDRIYFSCFAQKESVNSLVRWFQTFVILFARTG